LAGYIFNLYKAIWWQDNKDEQFVLLVICIVKTLVILFLFLINTGFSQEVEDILKSRKFVLEATKITDDEGLANPAIRKLCFVRLDSSEIIVQWVANCDNNGLGGITLKGEITSFEMKKQKIKKETQYSISLNCKMDNGRVNGEMNIEIYSKSYANAILINNTSSIFIPKEMNILGKIVPLESSKVMIGSD
jgi:hypothetical protein